MARKGPRPYTDGRRFSRDMPRANTLQGHLMIKRDELYTISPSPFLRFSTNALFAQQKSSPIDRYL